jgi:hypothetical protein
MITKQESKKIHDILTDLLVTACEEGVEGHICTPSDEVYGPAYKGIESLLSTAHSTGVQESELGERKRTVEWIKKSIDRRIKGDEDGVMVLIQVYRALDAALTTKGGKV